MEIMVGYDGSALAKMALNLSKNHAKTFGARVHVITCITQTHEPKEKDMDKMGKADYELERIKKSFRNSQIPCTIRLLVNNLMPGETLVQYATENKIDEIIIGTRKRSKVGKLMFGSTTQYVILEAPCPVVSVK